jgi:hypothetical protein
MSDDLGVSYIAHLRGWLGRGAYLREQPAVLELLRRYDRLQGEFAGIGAILDEIERSGGLGAHWRSRMPEQRVVPEEVKRLAAGWRSAIAALADDPNTSLPT